MASVIHHVAHGFVAGDQVYFGNLVPSDCGLIEGDTYYVIAAGLTANDFEVSETLGGPAFALTFDITGGIVSPVPAYEAITDPLDPMPPPTTPPTTTNPTLTSDSTTGVVRLKVTVPNDSPSDMIRTIEVWITNEYDLLFSVPDAPIWTNAQVRAIPVGTPSFSIRAHPETWYTVRSRFVDVYGNIGAWSDWAGTVGASVETVAGNDSLQSALLDHQIGTVEIADGAITADLLAATIVLGSTIIAGDPVAQHVEMDVDGVRLVDASDNVVVNIPTDGVQPVSVTGNIIAGTLVTTLGAELRLATSLPTGSIVTAQSGVAAPTAAPVLAQSWDTPLTLTATHDPKYAIEYTASGGAGGATKVIYTGVSDVGTQWYVQEFLASTGALNRTLTLPANANYMGCAVLGTSLYVHAVLAGVTKVYKYAIAGLTLTTTYTPTAPVASGNTGAIASDGTNLYIAQSNGASAMKYTKYDSAMAVVSGPTTLGSLVMDPFDIKAGTFDFGAFRILIVDSATNVRSFNSAGTEQTNETFPMNNYKGLLYGDVDGTGARFWSWNTSDLAANTILMTKHTNWTWTTASPLYWVSYSWYDPDGTVHETAVGPRQSITMLRRKRLSVTTATIPGSGGADDPDNVRVYMKPNAATDPGVGTYRLQVTDALTQRYITDYASGGALDGTVAVFAGGTSAELKSSTSGWSLKGDGTASLGRVQGGGTSFPGTAVTDDRYYRTDLDLWFVYDGTRWLSVNVFSKTLPAGSTTSFAATTSNLAWAPFSLPFGASDIWLEEFDAMFFVNTGGTALSGSHSWALSIDKAVLNSAAFTTIGTVTINSGVNGNRSGSTSIAALLNNGTVHAGLRINVTKVGTPGAVFCGGELFYRLVAT